jgi:FkbM family methyltransferase
MFQCNTDRPIIVDCGSNIGMSILFFKRLYPKARIIGFEPDPYTFEILSENVYRNALTDVELHQCALGEHDRSITLYRPDVENGSSLRMNTINPRSGNSHSITVPAKRLSTYLPPHEVDLLRSKRFRISAASRRPSMAERERIPGHAYLLLSQALQW